MAPRKPKGLDESGLRLWNAVVGEYNLRIDELRILEDASREADLIEQLRQGLAGEPLTVRGSMGQTVTHPLITEVRQHRATLAALLGKLKLSDGQNAEGAGTTRATTARAAANARWQTGGTQ